LNIIDSLALIQKAIDLIGVSQSKLNKIRTVLPGVPLRIWNISENSLICYAAGEITGRILSTLQFEMSKKEGSLLSDIPPLSAKSILWDAPGTDIKSNIKEAILVFMPKISKELLIKIQREQPWINKIISQLRIQ
jgi:hypothetical protein